MFLPEGDMGGEAQLTVAGGLSSTSGGGFQMLVPLTIAKRVDAAGGPSVESGLDFTDVSDSGFGYHAGLRAGGGFGGLPGGYLGLRGGPLLSGRIEEYAWAPNVSLDAFAGTGISGEAKGAGLFGVGLNVSLDYYGGFRVPSGRPLRDVRGQAWQASWREQEAAGATGLWRLPAKLKRKVGQSWLHEGLHEYASIASFQQLALELQRLSAPSELTQRALRAAQEEAGHARACFDLAKHTLGALVEPEALPRVAPRPNCSLERLAFECWTDGCIGEAAAAQFAAVRAQLAKPALMRNVLRTIAQEESRHAALGWDILRWCLLRGGPRIRRALERQLGTRSASDVAMVTASAAPLNPELAAYGVLPCDWWNVCLQDARSAAKRRLTHLLEDLDHGTSHSATPLSSIHV